MFLIFFSHVFDWLLHVFLLLFGSLCVVQCVICVWFFSSNSRKYCVYWGTQRDKSKSWYISGRARGEQAHAQAVIFSVLIFWSIPSWARSCVPVSTVYGLLAWSCFIAWSLVLFPEIIMAREHQDSMTVLPPFQMPYSVHVLSMTVLRACSRVAVHLLSFPLKAQSLPFTFLHRSLIFSSSPSFAC